jgi:hypothetical protein
MNSPESKTEDPDTPYHTPYRDAHQFASPMSTLTDGSPTATSTKQHHNQLIATTTPSLYPQTPSMLVVLDDAASFTETVKQKTRQRREQEDSALASLKIQTKRLEAALSAEIKRRVDAMQQFQQKAKSEIQRVEELLVKQMDQDRIATEERLNILEERMANLECKWQSDVNMVQHETSRKVSQLQEQVAELKQQTEGERQSRLEREAALNQQITQLSNDYKELWQVERQERFVAIQQLTEQSVADDRNRHESERTLDSRIQQDLQELEKEIRAEQREREQADHEIVDGLNRYMEEVQKSLAYVSGI